MAETKIQWAHYTHNGWIGCSKTKDPGCRFCYAEADQADRRGRVVWGPKGTRSKTSEANWKKPHRWNMLAAQRGTSLTYGEAVAVYGDQLPECEGHEWDNRTTDQNNDWLREHGVDPFERPRVFCASLADVFEDWKGPIIDHKGEELLTKGDGRYLTGSLPECDGWRPARMSDLREDLFRLIDGTPNLDWLLLTKRPENIAKMWPWLAYSSWGGFVGDECNAGRRRGGKMLQRQNVWLGTSCSDQKTANEVIPHLLGCRDLSPVLFVSYEPALGPVDFEKIGNACFDRSAAIKAAMRGPMAMNWDQADSQIGKSQLDMVIVGGESGPSARPCHLPWMQSVVDQCHAAEVKCFVKQIGSNPYGPWPMAGSDGAASVVSLREAGRLSAYGDLPPMKDKKGGDMAEWPEDLRVRQMPEVNG